MSGVQDPSETAQEYAKQNNLKGTIIADPTNLVMKMFQAPFNPYMLLFEKDGILKYNAVYMGRDKTYGFLYGLLENN